MLDAGRYIRLPALLALNVMKGLILLGLGKILSTTLPALYIVSLTLGW